jgi:cytidyltransferase-like protein
MGNNIIDIGKRLDNLNNVIKDSHPQDTWILDKVLPLFIVLINSATTPEQEQRIINIMNPLFDNYEYRFGLTLENVGQQIARELLEQSTPIVALYPGKFKPPHAGHFDVVQQASKIADEVVVIMSNIPKDEFTPEESMKVWSLYKDLLPSNVEIKVSTKSSPVSEVFDIVKDKSRDFIVLYGKGERSRYAAIDKDREKYSNVQIVDAGTAENLNATDLRIAIRNKDLEDIQTFLPKGIDAKKIFSIYSQDEFKPGPMVHESKILSEAFTKDKAPIIQKLVTFACEQLQIEQPPIKLINSPTYTQEHSSFGGYYPSEQKIVCVVHNRNMADILRTLAHELVHHMQNGKGELDSDSGEDGSPSENEANSTAGIIMRKFGRDNPEIFESKLNENVINTQTISCENCGWEWDLADGGNDPYICHKCGYDNTDEYDVESEEDFEDFIPFLKEYTKQLSESKLTEAEYQGRTVSLGKPMQGDSKKFKVYVKNPKGKVVKVNFGAKGMNIKKNNPVRRRAFRARFNCDNPGPRDKARYWSCRKW